MESRKKDIQSVDVNTDLLYKTCPPQYDVTISYKDGSQIQQILTEDDIAKNYWVYLNKQNQQIFSRDRYQIENSLFEPKKTSKPQDQVKHQDRSRCVIL